MLNNILLIFTIFILFSTAIFSTYTSAKINNENVVNEENKKFTTPVFTTILIIQVLYIIYTIYIIIKRGNYTSFEYVILGYVIVGIIISLIYLIQRDNQEVINKNFVFYTLMYEIITLFLILSHISFNFCKLKNSI